MFSQLNNKSTKRWRIILTGSGRVALAVIETLVASGISKAAANKTAVGPFWAAGFEEYIGQSVADGLDRSELFQDPTNFESNFMAYANMLIYTLQDIIIVEHLHLPERTQSKRNLQFMSQI